MALARPLILILLALLTIVPVSAQRGGGRGGRQQQKKSGSPDSGTPGQILIKFEGTLKSADKKEIHLDVAGDQSLIFRVNKKTSFYKDEKPVEAKDVVLDTHAVVDGRKEMNGDLVAVNVWSETPKKE
jgi:hypothetical protein